MKRNELEALMREYDGVFFDTGPMFHGYRAYMRDYEFIVGVPGVTRYRGVYSYVFRYCIEARTQTKLPPDLWRQSLDDRLTNYQTYSTLWDQGIELDGFVWSVGSDLRGGWRLIKESELAAKWSRELGMDFHEMLIETNAYDLRLVFSDLFVRHISPELPEMVIPGTDGFHWWLERYWSAPAPSLPFYLPSTSIGTPVTESNNAEAVQPRASLLSTMSFHVLVDGESAGLIQPVGADKSTGVVTGWFTPHSAYQRVRELFQQITFADRASLPEVRELAMEHFDRTHGPLNLTIITAGGRPVPTRSLQIHDLAQSGAQLNGYEAEFTVATTGFFNDPRYWSG